MDVVASGAFEATTSRIEHDLGAASAAASFVATEDAWCSSVVGDIETAAMRNIRRWLKGEIFDRTTGIRLVGGPRDGRCQIVQLDMDGQPSSGLRTGNVRGDTWSVYLLSETGGDGVEHSWVYRFAGTEPRS